MDSLTSHDILERRPRMNNQTPPLLFQFARLGVSLTIVAVIFAGLSFGVPANAQDGSQQTHVVQSGENLFRIALRYGITVDALATANGITDPTLIYAGQTLVIPSATAAPVTEPAAPSNPAPEQAAPAQTEPVAVAAVPSYDAPVYHIVERGQTLASIGRQYGINWTDLATWNQISDPNTIFAGQRLIVNNSGAPSSPAVAGPTIVETSAQSTEPAAVPADAGTQRLHTVRVGDRLASIARQYGISWPTIARANNISNPNQIYAGQQLVIPAQDDGQGTYLVPNGGVPSAPAPTIATGKQIIVDLSDQAIYAYENGNLLKSVIVSTGLPGTPTVRGDFRVYWKLNSQTMSGPGYYLPGVPWVMYFYQGYAIHGTYWHNNFGSPMSHGCVNLPTPDAQWFFNWAEVGTPVKVIA